MPIARPIDICSTKTRIDDPERGVGVRRELDHSEHERDPDRVVRARLAFEDRAGATGDLALSEHGEHHRGVGGRDRRAEEAGGRSS